MRFIGLNTFGPPIQYSGPFCFIPFIFIHKDHGMMLPGYFHILLTQFTHISGNHKRLNLLYKVINISGGSGIWHG